MAHRSSTVRPGKPLILASAFFAISSLWVAGCQSSNSPAATTAVPSPTVGQPPATTVPPATARATMPIIPTTSATATTVPAKTVPAITPTATTTATKVVPTSQPAATLEAAIKPSLDTREVVVTEADLGPNWKPDKDGEATLLDPHRSLTTLRWSDPASQQSPELFSMIVTEVVVYPDAAAAQLEVNKMLLRSDCKPTNAPSVGDISHACIQSVDTNTNVVFIEAASGNVWLKAGVYGNPRSEVKVTKAAELVRLMISRLPSGSQTIASISINPTTSTVSEGVPTLKTGTLEDARKAVGIDARTPAYLPVGAKPDGPVRFIGSSERGMVSISYSVDKHHLSVEYHRGLADTTMVQGREEFVGTFTARVYTVSKEPGDPFPPSSYVVWQESDVTIKVTGTLSTDELLKVARSLY
jgi:hypothetical protein